MGIVRDEEPLIHEDIWMVRRAFQEWIIGRQSSVPEISFSAHRELLERFSHEPIARARQLGQLVHLLNTEQGIIEYRRTGKFGSSLVMEMNLMLVWAMYELCAISEWLKTLTTTTTTVNNN